MMTETQHIDEFRQEVRRFLKENLPPEITAKVKGGYELNKDELLAWHKCLYARGWAAPGWPEAYGGPGWSEAQKYVFEEECARGHAPQLIPMGLITVAPLLIAYASEEQKARYLPPILKGEEVWCQGFSEPEAGSDLAALRCRAVRDGDDYIVTGSKIWTTHAQWADWCELLVRTCSDGPRQKGITVLLVDMKSPGITVQPLPSLDGLHVLNQVFFEDVRVPVTQRVGEEGEGWTLLKSTIGHERVLNADVGRSKTLLHRLRHIAARETRHGAPLLSHLPFAMTVARFAVRVKALELCVMRVINDPALALRPESSLLKIRGTELQQDISRETSDALGPYALPYHRDVLSKGWPSDPVGPDYCATPTPFYFFWRKASISAGTNEVQRNIIAKSLLSSDFSADIQGLSEEQKMLQETSRRFLREEYGFTDRRKAMQSGDGYREKIWSDFAEMGWLALPFAEADGGLGGTALDLLLLSEVFGASLVNEPYLASVVLGGGIIAATATEDQKERLLSPLFDGSRKLAFAYAEPQSGYDVGPLKTCASRTDGKWSLTGHKSVVLGAPLAGTLLVTATCADKPGETAVFAVNSQADGVTLISYPTIDGRAAADVHLDGAVAELLGPDPGKSDQAVAKVLRQATLAAIGEAVGAMEAAVTLTKEHLNTRVQFGKPLAALQVLQHRLVDMFIAAEEARALGRWAAETLDQGRDEESDYALSLAKAYIGDAGRMVGEQAIQLHGAIAITDEFHIGHYLKRLTAIDKLFGDTDHHLMRLVKTAGREE
tara:strand:+ start:1384 stop:3711 length:2328 start_codon:yes stop_codon:yes gene_type:complete